MLIWAITFLGIALAAALLGFSAPITAAAAAVARVLFIVFLVLSLVALILCPRGPLV